MALNAKLLKARVLSLFALKTADFEAVSRAQLAALVSIARKLLVANVGASSGEQIVTYSGMRRTTGRSDPAERVWVYHRNGAPCRKCGTVILSRKQGTDARTSFWCPVCQAM